MCKGKDVLKVAAIGAALYTGGASLGLFGAEAAGATALAAEGAGAGLGFGAEIGAGVAGTAGTAAAAGTAALTAESVGATAMAAEAAGAGLGVGAEVGSAAASGAGGAATAAGANTWLQTAKAVAPFVSAAGSAMTGIAALSGLNKGAPDVAAAQSAAATVPEKPASSQSALSPDLYAMLKKKNSLLFGGGSPESTDLTKGTAGSGFLGKNALLGA